MSDTKPQQSADLRHRRRRSSLDDIRETITSTISAVENKVHDVWANLTWNDLPSWRKDNAYITTGYRPLITRNSYWSSFTSIFRIHNETVNIWSHLLGALAAIGFCGYTYHVVHPRYATASNTDILVFGCFFAGAVVCLGMSATYHAVLDHSEAVSKWGNKLDYTGIVALIVGSHVPTLYYGFYCHPTLLTIYMSNICLMGLGCTAVSWFEKFRTPEWRPYRAAMFVGLGGSGAIPVLHGMRLYGWSGLQDRIAVGWILAMGASYVLGAVIYALRFPERLSPGTFDIWGSSHQIFHLFVVIAFLQLLYGMVKAFDYHHTVLGSSCLDEYLS